MSILGHGQHRVTAHSLLAVGSLVAGIVVGANYGWWYIPAGAAIGLWIRSRATTKVDVAD